MYARTAARSRVPRASSEPSPRDATEGLGRAQERDVRAHLGDGDRVHGLAVSDLPGGGLLDTDGWLFDRVSNPIFETSSHRDSTLQFGA